MFYLQNLSVLMRPGIRRRVCSTQGRFAQDSFYTIPHSLPAPELWCSSEWCWDSSALTTAISKEFCVMRAGVIMCNTQEIGEWPRAHIWPHPFSLLFNIQRLILSHFFMNLFIYSLFLLITAMPLSSPPSPTLTKGYSDPPAPLLVQSFSVTVLHLPCLLYS